jgi:hypothetical protein
MRRGLAALAFLLAAPARADVVARESFDYVAGTEIDGQDGGSGWAIAWISGSPAGSRNTVGTVGLDVPADGDLGVAGLSLRTLTAESRVYRRLDLSRPALAGVVETETLAVNSGATVLGKDGTTIWLSFIGHIASGTGGNGGLHLYDGLPAVLGDKTGEVLFIGDGASFQVWGLERTCWDGRTSCSSSFLQSGAAFAKTLHWVVVRMAFATGNTQVTMWLDPTVGPVTPADAPVVGPATVTDFHFDTVEVGSSSEALDVDEVRIATSYPELTSGASVPDAAVADALPPPPPPDGAPVMPDGAPVMPDGAPVVPDGPDGPDTRPDGPDMRPDGPDARPDGPDARPDGPDIRPDGLDVTPDSPDAPRPSSDAPGPDVQIAVDAGGVGPEARAGCSCGVGAGGPSAPSALVLLLVLGCRLRRARRN